ncbi:DUF1648 domain-containing protein [Pseudonocardia xishanensis]|uniref:DUF1648 domain-containing protein n=1 Tax=Pseudonocardia xishanensis TaxID=630995 RepID=A0ABP8RN24_9PSEU
MSARVRRILRAAVPPVVAAVPAVVVLVRGWSRLPETVASHFTLDGAVDGTSGRVVLVVLAVGAPLLLALVFGGIASAPAARRGRFDSTRAMTSTSWATGTLVGGLALLVVLANLDAVDPRAVVLSGPGVLGVLAATLGAGLLGWWLTPASPLLPVDAGSAPVLHLGETERASWTGRSHSRMLAAMGALMVPVGLVIGLLLTWVAGATLLAAGLLLVWSCVVTVTVDRAGLTVGWGPFGLPLVRVPLADVAEAHVEDVVPLGYGGWGLRLQPGTVAVVLRAGPGLVVTRRSGRTLVVTVDGAETGAGLLNGLRDRAC